MLDSSQDPDVLIQRYLEGLLTEEEAAALLAALEKQPELGHALLDHLNMDAMLDEVTKADAILKPASSPIITMPRQRFGTPMPSVTL